MRALTDDATNADLIRRGRAARAGWLMLGMMLVAIGFAVSFVCAWVVVKTFLGYVQRHGFGLFAWWRVLVGSLGLIALALGK